MLQGEICTAQSRIIVPRSRYDEIVDAFAEQIAALPVGDPAERDKVIGPMITSAHRERVEDYIRIGADEGATVKVGGGRPAHLERGWYLEPTLLRRSARTTCASRARRSSVRCAVVIPHDGVDDAIAIANDSPFGLSGTVWTEDEDAALGVARRVRTGTFALNTYTVDPTTPFGGYKESGIGREMGVEGLDGYVEFKSVAVAGPSLA